MQQRPRYHRLKKLLICDVIFRARPFHEGHVCVLLQCQWVKSTHGTFTVAMGYEEMQAANRPSFIMQITVCPTRDRQNGRARKIMDKAFFTLLCRNAVSYSDMVCILRLYMCVCCKYANFVEIATCVRAQRCTFCVNLHQHGDRDTDVS